MIHISPLNANGISSFLQNIGLTINPVAQSYMGVSKVNASYAPGNTVNDTCLYLLTYSINKGYSRYIGGDISSTIYNRLISIGSGYIPALGNSKPSTYIAVDPTNIWARPAGGSDPCIAELYGIQQGVAGSLPGPATSGYSITSDTGQGQEATWIPYDTTNANVSVTQWGYIRLHALQAWNEFNWNGDPSSTVRYQDFCASFMSMVSFLTNTNYSTNAFANAPDFLDGVYSNMNDLITADITGVSLSTKIFGQDCITLGNAIDLLQIQSFGMPSSLLKNLKKNNAITQSLSLALLSTGLTGNEIESIIKNATTTVEQEQKIYGAFLIIVGRDLVDILIPLNCKTLGLESLADLLNPKKIFPNSYQSLTVPLYNIRPSITNSKTYYQIYDGTSVSPRINTPAVKQQVGTIIIVNQPITNSVTTSKNIQDLPTGFGSYLSDILPNDIALAAGAFSYTMRQVKNIQNVDFEKFAQVAFNLETTKNLDLINGTNVPANVPLMNQGNNLTGLGSGPNNSYTVSDFFGCMSGLPYNWKKLTKLIQNLQTTKLSNIYHELYLAITWEAATLTYTLVEIAPNDYRIDTLTVSSSGGGYGRGSAVAPTISLPYGATATCTIGTDPSDLTNFGRVTSVTLTNPGTHNNNSGWYARIEAPPTEILAVQTNGNVSTAGVNTVYTTVGWPSPMDDRVDKYITQANTEITAIYNSGNNAVPTINSLYNQFGSQLMREQRARYIAVSPVPIPRDYRLNPYPTMQIAFIDSLNEFSKNTLPHMQSQTIEAITDFNTIGGQSAVASMRESRNKSRTTLMGVPLDNEIPTTLGEPGTSELLCNGTVNYTVNGVSYTTIPSTETQVINNVEYSPDPDGVLLMPGDPLPNQNNPYGLPLPPIQEIQSPVYVIDGVPLDVGKAAYPGSFAGSNAANIVPITLNSTYSSGTSLPSSYTVPEAIEQVIHCNCDCWLG